MGPMGLDKRIELVEEIVGSAPDTKFAIDHMGFFRQPMDGADDKANDSRDAMDALLGLAKYTNVYVKLSAFFRLQEGGKNTHFSNVKKFVMHSVIPAFTSERLMWGSDYPYVLIGGQEQQETKALTYQESVSLLPFHWKLHPAQLDDIMRRTAKKLFIDRPNRHRGGLNITYDILFCCRRKWRELREMLLTVMTR